MTTDFNQAAAACALLLTFCCLPAGAEEKTGWPVERGAADAERAAPAAPVERKAAEGIGGMQHGQMGGMNASPSSQPGAMGGMQHEGMGGMSQGGGMGGMQHGQMGGMSQSQPAEGGMGGMQHGGAGGGMGGMGGMMGSMPAMSEQEKEDMLKKALELDLKLGQLRIRITQVSDEAERERLKAEHRAVFKEYLPKLHKLMMQAHMEMKMQGADMKMPGGAAAQPMKH